MDSARLLSSGLSFLGALFQLGVIWGMDPPDWRTCRIAWCAHGEAPDLRVFMPWAPHIENFGDGRSPGGAAPAASRGARRSGSSTLHCRRATIRTPFPMPT